MNGGGDGRPAVAADPVLARRGQVSRLVTLGQRVGYAALAAAVVVFVVGFASGFTSRLTTLVVVLMGLACVVLPPAIVFGYGVRAADRHEAQQRRTRQGR